MIAILVFVLDEVAPGAKRTPIITKCISVCKVLEQMRILLAALEGKAWTMVRMRYLVTQRKWSAQERKEAQHAVYMHKWEWLPGNVSAWEGQSPSEAENHVSFLCPTRASRRLYPSVWHNMDTAPSEVTHHLIRMGCLRIQVIFNAHMKYLLNASDEHYTKIPEAYGLPVSWKSSHCY